MTVAIKRRFDKLNRRLLTIREAYRVARAGFGGSQDFSTVLKYLPARPRPYIIEGAFLRGEWQPARSFANIALFETYVTAVMDSYASPEDARKAYELDFMLSRAFGPWLSQIYVWHEIGKPPQFEHRNLLKGVGRDQYDGVRTSRLYDTVDDLRVAANYIRIVAPETWRTPFMPKHTFDPNLSVEEMRLIAFPPKRKPAISSSGIVIEMKNKDGSWSELYGHACYTEQDAVKYCLTFGPSFRVKYEEAA